MIDRDWYKEHHQQGKSKQYQTLDRDPREIGDYSINIPKPKKTHRKTPTPLFQTEFFSTLILVFNYVLLGFSAFFVFRTLKNIFF